MMMKSNVAPDTPEANLLTMLFTLREPDVWWLINWGCFKMAYTLVSQQGCSNCPVPMLVMQGWPQVAYTSSARLLTAF